MKDGRRWPVYGPLMGNAGGEPKIASRKCYGQVPPTRREKPHGRREWNPGGRRAHRLLYGFKTFETVGRPFRVLGPKITEGAFELQGPVGPDGVVS
jgi:hypothetical protein